MTFELVDELHDESQGEFATLSDALAEATRLAALPWDSPPNLAPCRNWKNCGRNYEVVEYDSSDHARNVIRRIAIVEVSARGLRWSADPTSDIAER